MIAPQTVAVTTPTGQVGRHVVRALLSAGAHVRVLLRDPARLGPEVRDRVEVAVADLTDVDAVVAATSGVTALYWVDPPSRAPDPLETYAAVTASVCAAVEEHDLERVVFQSSVGAERRHGLGEIDGLAATEVALDEVARHVVHLRCGYFFSNLLHDREGLVERGELSTAMPVDVPFPWVAPRDVAEVAAGWLLHDQWVGRRVQAVHGPQNLSFDGAAAELTRVLGRPLRAVHVPPDDLRATLIGVGMTPAQADALVGMTGSVEAGRPLAPARDLTSTTPTTLAAWAQDHLL